MEPEDTMFGARRWYHPNLGKFLGAALALEAGLYLSGQFGYLPLSKGVPVLIAVAIAGALLVFVLASFLVSRLLSWRFQFSSRSLLAMVLVVAVPCSWLATAIAHSEQQRKAVDSFKDLGCQVEHEPNVDGDTPWGLSRTLDQRPVPLSQSPLVRLLGADFFTDVVYVDNTPIGGSAIRLFRDADMRSLHGLSRLRHLTLDFNSDLIAATGSDDDVSDAGMMNLGGLAELRQLTLSNGRKIGDGALGSLRAMPRLRRLSFYGVPRISDAGLANTQGLRELRALTVVDASVSGTGLENLKHLENLRELTLNGNPITDAGMEHIERLGNLEVLFLERTRITDAGLQHIGKLTKLQVLSLDGTKIGDDGLRYLRGLTNLRILTVAGTQVTDAGLEHLKGLHQLEQLGLDGTKVTDAGLRYLEGLTKLQVLVLDDTRVSDAGRNHLKTLNQFALLDLDGPVMCVRDAPDLQ